MLGYYSHFVTDLLICVRYIYVCLCEHVLVHACLSACGNQGSLGVLNDPRYFLRWPLS